MIKLPQLLSRRPRIASQFAAESDVEDGRQRWLLISNCQGYGMANCLRLYTDNVHIESYAPLDFEEHSATISSRLNRYDRLLISPALTNHPGLGIDFSEREGVSWLPTFRFDGYHPDACHLESDGTRVLGPLRGLQSLICFVAFQAGLSEQKTRSLYTESIYSQLGYWDRWDAERRRLLSLFRGQGYDVGGLFVQWCRGGPFMHTINHPHIRCLADVARLVLERMGEPFRDNPMLPHDNLAIGPNFPIYPEVGVRLGVRGSYRFKVPGEYRCIDLDEFVHQSFNTYRGLESLQLASGSRHLAPVAESLREILDEE